MSEKMARRNAKRIASSTKQQDNLPKCKLDFKTIPKSEDSVQSAGPSTDKTDPPPTTQGLDASKKITDPKVAQNRAQKLIQAQRDSVDMLTSVRERVENTLPDGNIIQSSLDAKGYFVFDDFLESSKIIGLLRQETLQSTDMLSSMEVDISNIGSGEYIASIKGGEEQYALCPRLVELVVSTTKHLPVQLETNESKENPSLDTSACMATLRTFDRSAFKASLELLAGENSNEDDVINDASKNKPFSIVATEPDDQRKISMLYYILPETWVESDGGGISFACDGNDSSELVNAKSDRLVIFKSDTAKHRREPWRGNDDDSNDHGIGSCVELHFVTARKD